MPYQGSGRLPAEAASKLGHLEIVGSPVISELIRQFEHATADKDDPSKTMWSAFVGTGVKPLSLIFAVDGSMQIVASETLPRREVAFVKTALVRLDPKAVAKLDPDFPHPLAMRDMMKDAALFHAAALPLKGISLQGFNYLVALRTIIRDFMRDPKLEAEPYKTLQWLVHKQWSDRPSSGPDFICPHCAVTVPGFVPGQETKNCPNARCNAELFLTDCLDMHREMLEDSASKGLVSSYMLIHELLMLFTAIRFFWTNNRSLLVEALFLKDGPLTLRSQYSRLVPAIREFMKHAYDSGCPVHLVGQEKSGAFFDHLDGIVRFAPPKTKSEPPQYAVLSHKYVRREVQRVREAPQNEYGLKTNFGEKIYVKMSPYHSMVLNVPPVEFRDTEEFPAGPEELIGFDRIMKTLPSLLSHRFSGALVPIEMANGVASLSSYPSAAVLKVFAGLA